MDSTRLKIASWDTEGSPIVPRRSDRLATTYATRFLWNAFAGVPLHSARVMPNKSNKARRKIPPPLDNLSALAVLRYLRRLIAKQRGKYDLMRILSSFRLTDSYSQSKRVAGVVGGMMGRNADREMRTRPETKEGAGEEEKMEEGSRREIANVRDARRNHCDRTKTNRFDTDDTWTALYYCRILIVSNRDPAVREEIANGAIEAQWNLEKLYENDTARKGHFTRSISQVNPPTPPPPPPSSSPPPSPPPPPETPLMTKLANFGQLGFHCFHHACLPPSVPTFPDLQLLDRLV
ncbi:hypothetical protein G5I_05800 [Acromyrmex echinatior]|uniref:Uncharacterized protein n=1 Tax=Acromyrmex echinatior TaxID=103372 RepID=F4WJC1_ACREC|nr:hypothetical protein G5I_05800 [Acromyrmex echinatior]